MEKQTIKIFLIIAAALSLIMIITSCTTQKKCNRKFPPIARIDTVKLIDKELIYDTTFEIQADTSTLQAWLDCTEENEIIIKQIETLKSSPVQTKIIYKDKIIKVECWIDKQKFRVFVKSYFKNYYKNSVQTIEVNKLTRFQKIMFWTGIMLWSCVIIIIITWIAFRIKKKK